MIRIIEPPIDPPDDGFIDDEAREEYERRREDEAMDAWDEERIRA